jgi:hypothetical protein
VNDTPRQLSGSFSGRTDHGNALWHYVEDMHPETIAKLSKPESKEVFEVMERNIIGMLGGLPSENFDITVTTSRDQLGRLLASAIMSGYFLRNAEQRLAFERSLQSANLTSDPDSEIS